MSDTPQSAVPREGAPEPSPTTQREEEDPLVRQIEEAIKYAALLGDQAFDLVDGRELYFDRLAIRDQILALRRLASDAGGRGEEERHPDSVRLDWLFGTARFKEWQPGPLDVALVIGDRVDFSEDAPLDFRSAIDAARAREEENADANR